MQAAVIDTISELVREAALTEVLPRFRALAAEDIFKKPSAADPDDIVTTADRAAEAWLTPRLKSAVPGAIVVGEEAVARDPAVLDRLDAAPLAFLVDPVDGTKNFAAGDERFGVMVALLRAGSPVSSWIYLPITDELFVAEQGSGVRVNGESISGASARGAWRGTLHVRYLPSKLRARVPKWYSRLEKLIPPAGCAAVEYTDVALGRKDFTTFFRLHPWDHQPGALLLREAGGAVRHLDGRDYSAQSEDAFTIALGDASAWPRLTREVFGSG